MRLLPLLSISLLLLSWPSARAQTAEEFFNSGAQFYISNNIPAALEKVEGGLKVYPGDEKLKKLEELLKQQSQQNQQQQDKQQQDKQQKQQQQNQSQQQQQKDQTSQPQKSDDQQNQQQKQQPLSAQKNSPDKPKPDEQKPNQSGQKKDEPQKQPGESKASAEKKDGEKVDEPGDEGQPVKPGEMTPEEAKRLLDAQKGNEQVLRLQPKGKPQDLRRPVKDW